MYNDYIAELADLLRLSPIYILFSLSFLVLLSPPVQSKDFPVYRLQQFDLNGFSYGSRSALFSLEARPAQTNVFHRRCIVIPYRQLSIDLYKDLVSKGVGAVVVLLPADLRSLEADERKYLSGLEQELVYMESSMPVYFVRDSADMSAVFDHVRQHSGVDTAETATQALFGSVFANSFHFVVTGKAATPISGFTLANVQGKLSGLGIEDQLPTIIVSAHYDSFGVAPMLSYGVDSNGSGMVALLELARILSRFYRSTKTHPKYNILFVLTAAGQYNYLGVKRWLEEHLDVTESALLSNVQFAICLDTIGTEDPAAGLLLHVSRPPKNGTAIYDFVEMLQTVVESEGDGSDNGLADGSSKGQLEVIHKKINLAEESMYWQHERFSLRRVPALTMSRISNHLSAERRSITDLRSNPVRIQHAIRVLALSLAQTLFGSSNEVGRNASQNLVRRELSNDSVESLLSYLTQQPRAQQLVDSKHPLIGFMHKWLSHYTHEAVVMPFKSDAKDPEFVFYSGHELVLNAYSVKPAVFDLFLSVLVAAYLAVIFAFVWYFNSFLNVVRSVLVGGRSGAGKEKSG